MPQTFFLVYPTCYMYLDASSKKEILSNDFKHIHQTT